MRADERVVTLAIEMPPLRLTTIGTSPILRPIFHKMKNAGRVILEECKERQKGWLKANDMLIAK